MIGPDHRRGDDPAGADEVAEALNEACRAVVAVARSGDAIATEDLARRLDDRSIHFAGYGQRAVADFVSALAALLRGTSADAAGAGLTPPYRAALEAVAADIARPGEEADDVDWVAGLAARVAMLVQRRDRAGARALAERLEQLRSTEDLDLDSAAYFDVLLGVLAGRDVRVAVLGLVEPFRSAYLSLEAVVRGTDPRAGLVERVQDNASLVLQHGDAPAREGLAAALADVQREAERRGEAELARFIRAVGALVDGGGSGAVTGTGGVDETWVHRGDGDGAEAAAVAPFEDPELAEAWTQICAAWAMARAVKR
jgi:hypothetical protein